MVSGNVLIWANKGRMVNRVHASSNGICLVRDKTPGQPVPTFIYQTRRCMWYGTLPFACFYGLIRFLSAERLLLSST
ncbi:hypothetical protein PILCRDRAFT_261407 [Piloderma croceum F 1598]|uniref:Uncharacterized protein n=1 Tax=Piloderma croceum (strain F 1598) TaxID=765440 RepID=A0A0C3FTV6_PILCF|nr:hypothetical protein PILCRDRAFT_261407 [Piloderma croceum F 1598]